MTKPITKKMQVKQSNSRSTSHIKRLFQNAKELGEIEYSEAKKKTLEFIAKEFDEKEKYFTGASGIAVDFKLRIVDSGNDFHRINPRNYKEYHEWRTAVFTRDSFTCQQCGSKGNIQAHHIKQYALHADEQLSIENGLTLCKTCHNKIPRQRRP